MCMCESLGAAESFAVGAAIGLAAVGAWLFVRRMFGRPDDTARVDSRIEARVKASAGRGRKHKARHRTR